MLRSARAGLSGLFMVMILASLVIVGCTKQAQTPVPAPTPATTNTVPSTPTTSDTAVNNGTYGSKTAALKTSWTLEEMLQYAIEDEYMARAEYKYVIATFGNQNPFANIVAAEETHIGYLKGLYAARNMTVPEDKSAQYLVKPATIKDSLSLGVEAEIANIKMYKGFLGTPNLPDDVKAVFNQLQAASESHLSAFQTGLQRYQ